MNITIEQCNHSLEVIRNANGFWKYILQDMQEYLIRKIAYEYDRYNRHPYTDELITHKEEKEMTIFSEYQRSKTEQKMIKDKNLQEYKKQEYEKLDNKLRTQTGVPDMRKAMEKVRSSKATINRDYMRLTSSSLSI